MKKLFINSEPKGEIKKFYHDSRSGMMVFILDKADISAIAFRDDELMSMAAKNSDEIHVRVREIQLPDGMDADSYGAMLIDKTR